MIGEGTGKGALTQEKIMGYECYLQENEKSAGTIIKYLHDVRALLSWLEEKGKGTSKENVLLWRTYLQEQSLTPRTINAKLSAVNSFFRYIGWEDCRVRFLKVQRRLFRNSEKDLTRAEYERLLKTAQEQGRERLCLLMETICATGIRVSELRFITLEAVQAGQVEITSKGKVRTILLPGKLCRKLKKYARTQKIESGAIFRTRTGQPISRRQVWSEMKCLCKAAGVDASKVFPHNLRHLFATLFYKVCRDIVKLADVLGHSSIETTRIYLISTGAEHRKLIERLRLVQ